VEKDGKWVAENLLYSTATHAELNIIGGKRWMRNQYRLTDLK
jgi:hypothetical protein